MTEPTFITGETAKKRRLYIPVIAGIIAIAVIGFLASRAGLDKALVKQQVDDFIVQMKEKGRAQGRDLNLTYGKLEVVGSFASKHVVIHDPVLTVKPLERKTAPDGSQKIDALRITTPTLEIYPQTVDMSSLRIQASQPIDFAGEDAPAKSLLSIKANAPQIVLASQKKVNEVVYSDVEYQAPSEMEFTYLKEHQAKGAEEATPSLVAVYETMILKTSPGGKVTSSMAVDKSGLGQATVDFKDIVITPQTAPQGALKLAEINGKWSNMLNENKLNVIGATLKAGPVTSDNVNIPYLPIELNLEATYEGAMPRTAEAVASIQSPESVMVLKNLSLTSKDASLKATANFTASTGDVLPVGTANIVLTNTPYVLAEMRKFGILSPTLDPLVMNVLTKVTATPADQLKDVNIPIERARGGAFKIGASTFEELFAIFLQGAMQMKAGKAPATITAPSPGVEGSNAPLVPTLPPADKPKLAPIEIPDQGVRG
ncbi:MAG: hypothetical protein ACOYNL_01085 [Rickettsiales bacterium]